MARFVEGEDRRQSWLLPRSLDDYVAEDNPVRVVDAFIDELDFGALGFAGIEPAATGRPSYHPATLLKIYLYGCLNRVQSSRRLEREAQAQRRTHVADGTAGAGLQDHRQFPSRQWRGDPGHLPTVRDAVPGISGCSAMRWSRWMAASSRRSIIVTATIRLPKVAKRIEQVEASIERYLAALDRADRETSDIPERRTERIGEKIAGPAPPNAVPQGDGVPGRGGARWPGFH